MIINVDKQYRKLTPLEELFVDAYCGESNYNALDAYAKAGYAHNSHHAKNVAALEILRRPAVANAIRERISACKSSVWLTEDVIVNRLWEEATRTGTGSSHASRIQALVMLGKHIGMWQDKVLKDAEEKTVTYNVVNYVSDSPLKEKVVKEIENQHVSDKDVEKAESLGIQITQYE